LLESMGREKAARKAHGALKTQSFTGPGARQALGQSIKSKLHLSADEQKLADKGHILDEKGDAWWRRIGYADSREEFLKFWTALRPEFREGPVPPPDGTTCKRCKMHVNLSRKPVTRNNVHRSRKNCDGGCWGQESVTLIRLWCETHELRAEDTKKTFGTYSREAQGCPYQNKDVVPSEALEQALKSRGELCQHGEAWARRIGASDDPEKLKAFTALWWDLAPQFRSWDVPPDDGRKCAQCACIFRLGFYRGTKWRDRCECNKGAKRLADEWKLMGYECYQKGLREKELVKPVQKPQKKKDAPASPRIEAVAPDVAIDELELHVKDEVVDCVEINQCVGCTGTGIATPSSRRRVDGVEDDATIQHERAVKV